MGDAGFPGRSRRAQAVARELWYWRRGNREQRDNGWERVLAAATAPLGAYSDEPKSNHPEDEGR